MDEWMVYHGEARLGSDQGELLPALSYLIYRWILLKYLDV